MQYAPLLAALSIMAALSAGASAQAQTAVQWGCDAPMGKTCYFAIEYAAGGSRIFSLASGRKMKVSGVKPGVDQYLVSIDAPNLGDINRCRQLIAVGRQCQAKVVDPSYND
jgi:hypothetical protein